MSNSNSGDSPALNIEDYGSSDSEGGSGPMGGSGSQGGGEEALLAVEEGKYSGGTEGTTGGSNEGEFFGEYRDTGTGVDLTEGMENTGVAITEEMENTDLRSGLVKGGEEGASDAAGPGQYGGAAGGLNQG